MYINFILKNITSTITNTHSLNIKIIISGCHYYSCLIRTTAHIEHFSLIFIYMCEIFCVCVRDAAIFAIYFHVIVNDELCVREEAHKLMVWSTSRCYAIWYLWGRFFLSIRIVIWVKIEGERNGRLLTIF